MSQYGIGWRRGQFELTFYDAAGKRRRYSLGTNDPRRAELLAPEVYAELTKPRGKTVEELWMAYLIDMEGRAVSETMRHTWKALKERFGHLLADRISTETCRAHMRARRTAGIQDGSIHTELGHLRMVLRWAEKRGYIPKDSASHIERPPKPKSKTRHLTRAELRKLLDATPFPHIRTFIALAYGTAARSKALLGLTWDRCDFDSGLVDLVDPTITVPHKGRAVVPMTSTVEDSLKHALRAALTDYVIEWAGARVASVKRGVARAGKRAGIGHVTAHMLRHSAAVHMAEDGVPIEEIAQFLGHSNVTITRRVYARFSPTYLRKAAKSVDFGPLDHSGLKRVGAMSLKNMVGATGIEPVTPTMST